MQISKVDYFQGKGSGKRLGTTSHYGAIRNNNTRMFKKLGLDTGFDSIGEFNTAKLLSRFLDHLNNNAN